MTQEQSDKYYIKVAQLCAKNSYAIKLQVGAIIVKDGQIMSDGFNGTPCGFENKCEIQSMDGDLYTIPYVLHAESNAILKCAKYGRSTNGSTLYITHSPCIECAKLIIQAGIIRVIYLENYKNSYGIELLKKAGIKVEQYTYKNKPRFNIGDWVVFINSKSVYKVDKKENYEYTLEYILGGSLCLSFSNEKLIRKWTIQDAKDCDILSCNEDILLFKSYSEQGIIYLYCSYNKHTNNFNSKEDIYILLNKIDNICPATIEQCNILFEKIKEEKLDILFQKIKGKRYYMKL